jgi:hypothetical protein
MTTEATVAPAKYSADWLKAELAGRKRLPLRRCSICGLSLDYVTDRTGNVAFDSNCDCVSYYTPLRQSSWDEVAETLAMQRNDTIRDNLVATMKGERAPE